MLNHNLRVYKERVSPYSRIFNSIASHCTCTSSSHHNQWISSLLSSPSPPMFPRLNPRPPLPSTPTVEEAAVLAAALSPRRYFRHDSRCAIPIITDPLIPLHFIPSRISFNSCSRVHPECGE